MLCHVCPWWLGPLLNNPLRRLWQNPQKILSPYVHPGMTVLEPGCATGFYSLELARLVGEEGRVICVDVQPQMIRSLERRAASAQLSEQIDTRLCSPTSLGVEDLVGQVDFACALFMAHEAPNIEQLFRQLHATLRTEGHLLLAEPRSHVRDVAFNEEVRIAQSVGFRVTDRPAIRRARAVLLTKAARPTTSPNIQRD